MRALKNFCEVAVIGGGLAGLSAARHAARLGKLVTLFEGSGMYGGQVATTSEVDGLPMPGKLSGQDLAIHLLEDARKIAVQVVESSIDKIDLDKRITITDQDNKTYHPEAIIVASGASLRKLNVPGEDEFMGRGVSHCATCDGGFYRNQDVVVVGGGDSAAQEAMVLAKTSRKVIMVCRSAMKAKRDYVEKLASKENVTFIWDSEVSEILGQDGVSGIRLRNVKNGTTTDLECPGLFPFIGVTPNTAFVPPSLLTASGHVKTDPGYATADPRVFAVGAARAEYGGNAIEAMAEGVSAAEATARLLVS
jgi:thioredoxin reductase (NADPH)